MNLRRCSLSLLALALLLLPAAAWAQGTQTGTLTGQATDSNGEGLPGVTVTATSPSLLGARTAFTGSNGDYVLRGLPPGSYTVIFELEGMTTVERTASVELGRPARVDARLQVSAVEETIVVRGESPTALETSSVGANYDAEMIDSLATSRTLFGIAQLAPGLTTNTPNGGQVTISGAFGYDNVFLVDGVDVNDNLFGSANSLFIEDAIEETQVLTSGISAEYGRFTGGVINAITKSGGNEFSGSFRVDLTNPQWRDETPLEDERGIEREDIQNEVFSATLGGYVVKDQVWFFLAGRDQSTATQHVMRITEIPVTRTTDNERFEIKLTGNINASHTLQATYTENETNQFRPSFSNSIDLRTTKSRTLPNDLSVVRYNGVLSSNLFAELQYSEKKFQFSDSGGTSTDIVDSPFFGFNQGLVSHYNAPYFDANDPEDRNNEQLAGSLSYFAASDTLGSHDVKFGFEQFQTTRTGGNSQSATSYVFNADFLEDANGEPIYDAQGRLQPIFTPGFDTTIENWIAVRGAELNIETTSFYVNDRWNLDDRWSFNIGFRYEDVQGDSTGGLKPVDTNALVPRLAASYDVRGDGKYKVDLTYAEYAGKYNETQFGEVTNVGNPDVILGFYLGPPGVGLDYAPGLDPSNYIPYNANFPTASVFFDPDISSPIAEEWTLSVGAEIGRGGYLKMTFTDREMSNFVEDFINDPLNPVVVESPVGTLVVDRTFYTNSDIPERAYQALQLQGRYRISNNWLVEGHWTRQLKNDGNFEGEAGSQPGLPSSFGDYPEVLVAERNFPKGTLNDFQEDRIRLWTTYNFNLGRAGTLGASLLFNYDSALTYSLADANEPLSAIQLARNPGYQGLSTQTIFFGERGSQEYEDEYTFDLALNYSLPVWRSVEPWLKLEVRNVLNEDKAVFFNTSVFAVDDGPVDEHGIPTTYVQGSRFGTPTSNGSFVTPREYRISAGIRF